MIPQDNSDVTNEDIFKMLAGELLPSDIDRRREDAERKRIQALVKTDLIAFYEHLSTRHLLSEYRKHRSSWYSSDDCGWGNSTRNFPLEVKNGITKQFVSAVSPSYGTLLDAMKEVLSRREHIPRGREARQLRAKERKGQGKSKNR